MSKDFDWNDKDSVIVKRVDAIAVYTNPNGDLVIRQEGSMGEEDHYIVLPPERIEDLIHALVAEKESLENAKGE